MTDLTKDERQAHAGLVRDIVAACAIKHPNDDERALRIALMKRGDIEAPKMEITHVRRLFEAACELEFVEPAELAFRQSMGRLIANHHKLRDLRGYVIGAPAPSAVAGKR